MWNSSLQEYVLNGQIPDEADTLLEHINMMETQQIKHQVSLLESVSNLHGWQYIRCDGQKSSRDIHVNLHDPLLYHPSCDLHPENMRMNYLPKSPRNRIMYYLYADSLYPGAITTAISELLKLTTMSKVLLQMI